jgi:hypothetical protein
MSDKTKAQLEEDVAKLAARVAELEKAGKPAAPIKSEPHQRLDLTARASMDAETMRDLARAIPDNLARDLRADTGNWETPGRGNPLTQSPGQLVKGGGERVQIERGSGLRQTQSRRPLVLRSATGSWIRQTLRIAQTSNGDWRAV